MGREKMTVVVVGLLAVWLQPTLAGSLAGAFSNSLGPKETITHEVVQKGDGFEVRKYPSKNWACTLQEGGYTDDDQMAVFFRLFGYLGGNNVPKVRMGMAAPVSIEYKKNGTETVFTACFLIETKHQADPPVPTDAKLFITPRPEMTVLTREFGGYATSNGAWLKEAAALEAIVKDAGKEVRSDVMYWNAYDAPFKFWYRRNEVWLLEATSENADI